MQIRMRRHTFNPRSLTATSGLADIGKDKTDKSDYFHGDKGQEEQIISDLTYHIQYHQGSCSLIHSRWHFQFPEHFWWFDSCVGAFERGAFELARC